MNNFLQSPPVPAECDVTGEQHLPLDISKLLSSKAQAVARRDATAFFALVQFQLRAWRSVPAGSLPADDSVLCDLAGVTPDVWHTPGFKEMALQGFSLATDGLLYHRDLAASALALWTKAQKRTAYIAGQRLHGLKAHTKTSSTTPSVTEAPPEAKPVIATEATSETKTNATEAAPQAVPAAEDFALVVLDVEVAKAKKKARWADEVARVFDGWKRTMGKPSSTKLSVERERKIVQRLEDDYSVDDILLGVLGCSKTPHNMGDNDRNTTFNDIELICRNVQNLDRFIEAGKRASGAPQMGFKAEATANAFLRVAAAMQGGAQQVEEQQLVLIGE